MKLSEGRRCFGPLIAVEADRFVRAADNSRVRAGAGSAYQQDRSARPFLVDGRPYHWDQPHRRPPGPRKPAKGARPSSQAPCCDNRQSPCGAPPSLPQRPVSAVFRPEGACLKMKNRQKCCRACETVRVRKAYLPNQPVMWIGMMTPVPGLHGSCPHASCLHSHHVNIWLKLLS